LHARSQWLTRAANDRIQDGRRRCTYSPPKFDRKSFRGNFAPTASPSWLAAVAVYHLMIPLVGTWRHRGMVWYGMVGRLKLKDACWIRVLR
jgi:hypothetical protein